MLDSILDPQLLPTLVPTLDGSLTLRDNRFGSTYHSLHGAIQEGQHVYVESGLTLIPTEVTPIRVLEFGFGSGLNALLTALEAERIQRSIFYTGVDNLPLPNSLLDQISFYDTLGADAEQYWRSICGATWDKPVQVSPFMVLQKIEQDFESFSSSERFDVVYFDAFAPGVQPHLWEAPLLERVHGFMAKDGVLCTYCAQGTFRRTLKNLGFAVTKIPGPPGKREITRAVKL